MWIVREVFIGSLVWILLLALMSQAISAWVKWLVAARAALLGAFFIPTAFAAIVNEIFQTHWGHIFDLRALIGNVWSGLFGTFVQKVVGQEQFRNGRMITQGVASHPPFYLSCFILFLISAFFLWLLSLK